MSQEYAPGPDGWPLVGCTPHYIRNPFEFRERCADKYGDIARFEIYGRPVYLISHPEYIEQVFVSDRDKFQKPPSKLERGREMFGNGLLMSEGKFWERQRKLIQPAFFGDRVMSYGAVITRQAERLATDWSDGDRYDIYNQMRKVTLRVLVGALFGTDLGEREDRVIRAFTDFSAKFNQPFYIPEWVPTPTNRRYKQAIVDFNEAIYDLIREHEAAVKESEGLLSRMLTADTDNGIQMTRKEVRDEVMTLMFAGHKTTALLLTFTWYLLSEHPTVERRLHEEIDTVLDGETLTPAGMGRLKYVSQIIKEVLRFYPPVHMMIRETTEEVAMGPYTLPEGAAVNLSQWVLHRDSRFYDDPETFRPARWTAEFESSLPEYAYFPFGGGPRQCVGLRFAQIEAQFILATLGGRFRLIQTLDTMFDLSTSGETLHIDGDVKMLVRERANRSSIV